MARRGATMRAIMRLKSAPCQSEKAKTARLTAAAVKTRSACPMAFLPAVPPTSSFTAVISE